MGSICIEGLEAARVERKRDARFGVRAQCLYSSQPGEAFRVILRMCPSNARFLFSVRLVVQLVFDGGWATAIRSSSPRVPLSFARICESIKVCVFRMDTKLVVG